MILYPAIDLKDGNAVRLLRGDMDKATVFNDDPATQAMEFVVQIINITVRTSSASWCNRLINHICLGLLSDNGWAF